MKNFEITFKKGSLIDNNTGKRLNLKPLTTYYILGDDNSFLLEDYRNEEYKPLDSIDKEKQLNKKYKGYNLKKLASKNEVLYFRIGLPKKTDEDFQQEYLFNAILDEDLYIKSKQNKDVKDWNTCECICHSNTLIEGNLGFPFEKIDAQTLNKLYRYIVNTYFNKKVAESCNIFQRFYFEPSETKPSLQWIKNNSKLNLDYRRIEIFNEQKRVF